MIDRHEVQDLIYDRITKVMDSAQEEFELSYADLLGVLEVVKCDILATYVDNYEYDEEGYEDDDEGEDWKRGGKA